MGKEQKRASGDKKDAPGKKGKNKKVSGSKPGLPKAVRASGKKVRRIFTEARDAALKKRGDAERADEAAFKVLSRTHQQVGERFERREKERRGSEATDVGAAARASAPPVAGPGSGRRESAPPAPDPVAAAEEEPVGKPVATDGSTPASGSVAAGPAFETEGAAHPVPAGQGPPSGPIEVETWTGTQLREAARRLDIPGRSRMSRDELVRAVQDAESSRSRPAGQHEERLPEAAG